MAFKHPISTGVNPDWPCFPDIYGFEVLPSFPQDIATFRKCTLTIFAKCSRKFQNIMSVIVDNQMRTKYIV